MIKFEHINDCVNALEACTNIKEVNDLLDSFPRWSGEWWVDTVENRDGTKYYEVTNQYYDKQTDELYCDTIDLDIEVEEED
jgi:hypothetical protein